MFFASCYFIIIIIIIYILLTFQSEMCLVRTEKLEQRGRVATAWIQEGKNILQFPFRCKSSPSSSLKLSRRSDLSWTGAVGQPPHPFLPCSSVSNPIGDSNRDWGLKNNFWISFFFFFWIKDAEVSSLDLKEKEILWKNTTFHKHLSNTHPSCEMRVPNPS